MTEQDNLTPEQRNCLELADHLEQVDDELFDMSTFIVPNEECGTAGCIAGHAGALWNLGRSEFFVTQVSSVIAADKLGLDDYEADDLFIRCPDVYGEAIAHEHVTKRMAAAALRRFVHTGRIYFDTNEA